MAAISTEAKRRAREQRKAWREANPELVREINKRNNKARVARYRAKNKEKALQSQKEYYQRNKNTILAYFKEYRDTSDKHKKSNAQWYEKNKHIKNAITARRRAQLKRANVKWANKDIINSIYAKAEHLSQETGIQHVVDHIIPLSSKIVCGLHCEHNLRVITAEENGRKGNKLLLEFR